jgi:L-asparaginase II
MNSTAVRVSTPFDVVAITRRSGYDESIHFGSVVALTADGSVALAIGDPDHAIYGRSTNKPVQATAMVRHGLELSPELLALVCASHSGTPRHIAGVQQILAGAGLGVDDLRNTPDYPLDTDSEHAIVRAGGHCERVLMNCSGKHSGMLATCVINGWPLDDYLAVDHPLQQAITTEFTAQAGIAPAHIGVDGCGAPAHVISLVGLARAFRSVAIAEAGSPEAQVHTAMSTHPFMVGGPGRDVTQFMEAIPGLMAKDGADGVFAAALPDGRAVALKIADGGDRARPPVLAAALAALGVDVADASTAWHVPINGHGKPVGEVRAAGALAGFLD